MEVKATNLGSWLSYRSNIWRSMTNDDFKVMQSGRHANHYLLGEKPRRKARLFVDGYLCLYGC